MIDKRNKIHKGNDMAEAHKEEFLGIMKAAEITGPLQASYVLTAGCLKLIGPV